MKFCKIDVATSEPFAVGDSIELGKRGPHNGKNISEILLMKQLYPRSSLSLTPRLVENLVSMRANHHNQDGAINPSH